MAEDDKAIEKMVLTQLLQLNATISGLITGIVLGGVIFIATIFLILKGGESVGQHLALLGQFFIGYQVTFLGSLVGLAYGFITGFLIGYIVAWLYNFFAGLRERKHI